MKDQFQFLFLLMILGGVMASSDRAMMGVIFGGLVWVVARWFADRSTSDNVDTRR